MSTTTHPMAASLRAADTGKIVSAREAVRLIRSGDTVATGGFVGAGEEVEIVFTQIIAQCRIGFGEGRFGDALRQTIQLGVDIIQFGSERIRFRRWIAVHFVGQRPVEIAETQTPLIFWRKEFRPDSGGAGRSRGGLGQIMEIESGIAEPFDLLAAFDRIDYPARGRDGGRGSTTTGRWRRCRERRTAPPIRSQARCARPCRPPAAAILHLRGRCQALAPGSRTG